ncbi:unnamed protein product [Candida verbasci]|uniref:Replication protein A C-terminal domain-containing protein n=1 Tax=Candida verbasci TaxID=1227364 RepID=A0A9W4TW18_9ASCO|nr:unnamed protein product [Candida verbasci]
MSDFNNYGNYGDGDGGFDVSQNTGGGFNNDHSTGGNGSQRNQLRQSLTPVTIKQINDSTQLNPDGEFKIHNVELNMISFIGIIRKVTTHQSAIIMTIEDGTGSIEVRKWIAENDSSISLTEEEEKFSSFVNEKYIFVGGSLRQFNNKKTIQNAIFYPIEDSNQIIYHHLSAIENHLRCQGIPKNTTTKTENKLFVDNVNPNKSSGSTIDKVLQVLKDNSSTMSEGVQLEYVVQKLNISREDAKNYCDELIESGKIYTGFDDNTYIAI